MNVTLSYVGCEVNVTLTEDEIYITRVGEYVTRYVVHNGLDNSILLYSGKLWRALNLAKGPPEDFKFGDSNAVRHTCACVNYYWGVLISKNSPNHQIKTATVSRYTI